MIGSKVRCSLNLLDVPFPKRVVKEFIIIGKLQFNTPEWCAIDCAIKKQLDTVRFHPLFQVKRSSCSVVINVGFLRTFVYMSQFNVTYFRLKIQREKTTQASFCNTLMTNMRRAVFNYCFNRITLQKEF